jgi:predicted RND superfamily exporter protein
VTLRERIDRGFEAWGRMVCARRYLVLSLCLLFLATMATFLPHMRAENDTQNYLHSGDPASIEYEEFQRRFGQDDRILIAVESREIFDLAFLEKLRAFHAELEAELPHIREVTSLINVRQTRGEDDALIVEDLMDDWPETAADLEDLRRRVLANPLYVDNVISRNGRFTALSIKPVVYAGGDEGADAALAGFDEPEADAGVGSNGAIFLSEDQKRELVAALLPVVERHDSSDFQLFVVGSPVVARQITGRMTSDSRANVSAVALAIVLFLFLLFRRVSGVLFPMAVVAAALISVLGVMVWLGIPFSIVLAMLPVFTMCVGVCYAVHVLVLVYQRLADGSGPEDAVAYAFGHSGLAILMTSLTTSAGMLSFLTAALAPVRNLGIVAPCGVLFAFVFSMTLLPALIAIFPLNAHPRVGATPQRSWPQRLLVWSGDLAVRRTGAVLGTALVLVAVVGTGLFRVRFAHVPLEWLPAEDPVRVASELVNRELRGATTAEVLIDTGRENGLQEPETLVQIDAAIGRVESMDRGALFVGKATSLVDVVKETHQALNANDSAFYRIPEDPALVAQELLLFENSGSDDLEEITDSQFRSGRVTLRMPLVDAVLYDDFLDEIEAVFAEFLGTEAQIVLTGRSSLSARTMSATIESMARSYVVALLVITPLMMLLIGNVRIGLISMVPNLLPVFLTLAVMGLLDIPLDASSIMVGSIVISLAVDDTIHFMHRFRHEFALSGDTRGAVRATLTTTGAALFFTTLVLATGFSVMGTLGTLKNTVIFGYLCALGIAIAFLADVLLTTSLIAIATRKLTGGPEPRYRSGGMQPPK